MAGLAEHSVAANDQRVRLASDRHRPLYHFLAPAKWLNDPNGAIYWKGKYHLFYQHNPRWPSAEEAHWGHAVSDDLVHWTDLPIALSPTPDGPDGQGCFSGGAVDDNGVPTLVYWGVRRGICIATSDDMITWAKSPHNPVIPEPAGDEEWRTHDPFAWKEGDTWYVVSGSQEGDPRGIGTSRDAAYMFRSPDLVHWEYMHPLYEPGEESDCAVPDFFPLGDKHMLLFASHTRGAQYYIGAYEDHRLVPERHGRMNFTTWDISTSYDEITVSGDLMAPHSWADPSGRRVMIAWIAEGRTDEAQRASGWAGVMSLPRVLSLSDRGELRIEPVPEMDGLRRDHRRVTGKRIGAGSSVPLDVQGDCLEIEAEFEAGDLDRVGVAVRSSPDGAERTVVSYSRPAGYLELDPGRSSLSSDAVGRAVQRGPLVLAANEPLRLRIFLDRSVVEVFANGRQCLTKRIYPSRRDSLGVSVFAQGREARLRRMDVWRMAAVWPETQP